MPANFEHLGLYPFLFDLLPAHLKRELDSIKSLLAPYTKRAYVVGGAVRDMLRSFIENKKIAIVDLDIEVYGIEPKYFDALMARLGAKGVGKSFFVYKYNNIDISLPRIETKVAQGHRGFEVQLAHNEKEASLRRDFCMNALMLGIFEARLLDFWGGVEDIVKKRIRIIDEAKFKEDSLRVLRGVQFAARFGYKIEPKSAHVMRSLSLEDLSAQRVFWEFEKMFKGEFLHYGLYYLLTLDIDRKIFKRDLKRFFYPTARELLRASKGFEEHLKKFYFLYILANKTHLPYRLFLQSLQTPREYYQAFRFQKALAKKRTERYIAALALRFALKNFLGNYAQDVKIRAKRLGFWEQKFQPIAPKDLLMQGLKGEALGKELKRRNLAYIRKHFKGKE